MSFLNDVRLVFAGRFQADVSTVNNDVRHYDNATFEPAFQDFQTSRDVWNGWWNPTGSGAFRLIDCRVVAAHYGDGTSASDRKSDPVIGMRIGGSDERTSGKIVDIDPQWQLASALWGLDVRLTDGVERGFFAGTYKPHAFRDLWFGRMIGSGGDRAAAATFQSVLRDLRWGKDFKGSRFLNELKLATGDALSIRLTTFGFNDAAAAPDFTLGTVVGVIGPQLPGDAESFVLGRRFAPANGTTSWNGCSYFSGFVDLAVSKLFLDLSNALQLLAAPAPPATVNDIGELTIGILLDPHVSEFTPATAVNFSPIGTIDYRQPGWLLATAGVVGLPLTPEQLTMLADHPLALAAKLDPNAGTGINGEFGQIAIRETADGLFVEAEPIVHRIDAPGKSEATIYAARYGAPCANTAVTISAVGRMPGQGGGQSSGPGEPRAPIPDIGVPEDRMHFPASVTTDPGGRAALKLTADDPGNPRGYLDGQLYLLDFRMPNQGNQARSQFDYVVVHVRDAFKAPVDPDWNDIAPIFAQYGNLYPIMSRGIVDMSNPADVKRHARILLVAFATAIENPNYMPVTRDLSSAKRWMIQAFLEKVGDRGDPALDAAIAGAAASAAPASAAPASAAPARTPKGEVEPPGGKTLAAQAFNRVSGRRGPR